MSATEALALALARAPEARRCVVVLGQVVETSEELHAENKDAGPDPSPTSAVTEILHVNSAILAAHSHYFMRMFSNGMSESSSGVAVVHVNEEGTPNAEKAGPIL